MTSTGVAFVTGASRGIGAACAVALARAGFDVAVAARTEREGTGVLEGDLVGTRADAPIAGSLEATAAAIEDVGKRALRVHMDVANLVTVSDATDRVLREWGPVNAVVNVAHYRGPGYDGPLLGTPVEVVQQTLVGDILAPVVILQKTLPGMLGRGSGTVVNMSSAVAFREPPEAAGRGGWGLAYAVGKGGFDRIAGVLRAEMAGTGIRVYNVEPGLTAYGDRLAIQRQQYPGLDINQPEEIGQAVAWLVTHPEEAAPLEEKCIHLPKLARDIGVV
jgi:NAD(P)-dependent dehydrogenase (short-subunit alcohol dehydrogenase family)